MKKAELLMDFSDGLDEVYKGDFLLKGTGEFENDYYDLDDKRCISTHIVESNPHIFRVFEEDEKKGEIEKSEYNKALSFEAITDKLNELIDQVNSNTKRINTLENTSRSSF